MLARTPAVEFVVPGEPVAWARAGGGKSVRRYTPGPQASYMRGLRIVCQAAMKGAPPIEGPVWLTIEAHFAWPRSWSAAKREANRWHTARPDYDNIAKIVSDALSGIAWLDDSQAASASVHKLYGEVAELRVRIGRLL
jgi:Holliday junction resolvase RusA-like endonuclease